MDTLTEKLDDLGEKKQSPKLDLRDALLILQILVIIGAAFMFMQTAAVARAEDRAKIGYLERSQEDMKLAIKTLAENQGLLTRGVDKLTILVERQNR